MKKCPAGTIINNRYKVLKPIGEGAFGTVYVVDDTLNPGVRRAIKEHTRESIPKGKEEILYRETKFLGTLSHPRLPRLVDNFFFNENYYIVMDYIEGDTLDSLFIIMDEAFTEEEIIPWMHQLCDILEYLHGLTPPVIFRDLKPSNIIITPENELKLIDFGTARLFNPVKLKDTFIMGTPGFAPPEQYGTDQSDARSDIYALGATFYFILTRKSMEDAKFIFPPLRELNPKISQKMEEIIKKCMDIDPRGRYATIDELRSAMVEAFGKYPSNGASKEEKAVGAQAIDTQETQSPRKLWVLGLLVPSILCFIVLLFLNSQGSPLYSICAIVMLGSPLLTMIISGLSWLKSKETEGSLNQKIIILAFWGSLSLFAIFIIFNFFLMKMAK